MTRMYCSGSLNKADLACLREALQDERAIVIPTDTVYGVAATPYSTKAVNNLLCLKGRGRHMPPPVLVPSIEQAQAVCAQVDNRARALMTRLWPGALTLILKANTDTHFDLGDKTDTIAIRMPDHPVALEILRNTGPLAVTSANLTGQPPATTCQQAIAYFGEGVAHYVDSGDTPGPVPSTIVDISGAEVSILRKGAIGSATIEEILAMN
ncbi:MAG: L-threonylcarbamoyladenylate synthase [Actinomycetaceae bacterium]|nr:L-threonylcarbamoyladenylate synthase [Actinomycetaceae bacterium]